MPLKEKEKNIMYSYYTIIKDGKKTGIVCVGSYAGKTVRGVARCNPKDTFDFETGKKLATARCEQKILTKRAKYMENKLKRITANIERTQAYLREETEYYNKVLEKAENINYILDNLEEDLR